MQRNASEKKHLKLDKDLNYLLRILDADKSRLSKLIQWTMMQEVNKLTNKSTKNITIHIRLRLSNAHTCLRHSTVPS